MGLALPSCPSRSISYTPGTLSYCSDWTREEWLLLYVWNIFRRVCYDTLRSVPIFARILGHICRSRPWVCTCCCLLWRWPRYEISWTVLLLIKNRKSQGKQGAFWLAPLTLWHDWIIPYLNKNNLESWLCAKDWICSEITPQVILLPTSHGSFYDLNLIQTIILLNHIVRYSYQKHRGLPSDWSSKVLQISGREFRVWTQGSREPDIWMS